VTYRAWLAAAEERVRLDADVATGKRGHSLAEDGYRSS
jgi:hypothetical protein